MQKSLLYNTLYNFVNYPLNNYVYPVKHILSSVKILTDFRLFFTTNIANFSGLLQTQNDQIRISYANQDPDTKIKIKNKKKITKITQEGKQKRRQN